MEVCLDLMVNQGKGERRSVSKVLAYLTLFPALFIGCDLLRSQNMYIHKISTACMIVL